MMSKFIEVDESNFDEEVNQSELPVLIDFGAVWCGPCKMLDPIVEDLAEEWKNQIKVVHIDVDSNQELTIQYSVMGVPTLLLIKNGEPIERMTGYKPKNKIKNIFEPHF
ncbi:MAG: thioredoxin [Anaerolineales bacterium]